MSGRIKKWLHAILLLTLFIVLLVVLFPALVERFVLPPLLERSGLASYTVSISRLGLNGCSLSIGGRPGASPPLVSGDLSVDWTPSGLFHKKIAKVSSSSLQINLAGFPSSGKVPARAKPPHLKDPGKDTSLPVIVEEVVVTNGSLLYAAGERSEYLPFTFSGKMLGDQDLGDPADAVHFQTRLEVDEHVIHTTIGLNPAQGRLSGKLDSALNLASLTSLFPAFGLDLSGNAQLEVEAAIQTAPFSVEQFKAGVLSEDLEMSAKGFSAKAKDMQPARVVISGSGYTFKIQGEGFYVEKPVGSELEFDTAVSILENSLQLQGTLGAYLPAGQVLQNGITLRDVLQVRIGHEGSISEGNGSTRFTSLEDDGHMGRVSIAVQKKDTFATVEKVSLDALITYEKKPERSLAGSLIMIGHNATVELPQGVVKIPKLALQSDLATVGGQYDREFNARLNVADASLVMKDQQLQLRGIQLALPVEWPPGEHVGKGSFTVETINFKDRDLGSIAAETVQNKQSIEVAGFLLTPLFPENKVVVSGKMGLPDQKNPYAEYSFSLSKGMLSVVNLEEMFPAMDGVSGGGELDVHGELTISPCGISGQADLAFANGRLSLSDAETELEGIHLSLRFPRLPSLATAPMQHLSVGSIRKNKILISELNTWFEIESPRSLFIEKIAGRWSGGRVFTSAFRLQKDLDELDLAVFCDRLELSSILSQFSLAQAGGEGRLSGRVPVSYDRGKLFVDDGFLFSSPGEKGQLKIKKSRYLETTIPADVPHFSPLHFAGAALADFEYDWAKLHINSVEENLLLKLQVDGKPRKKLPFRFDASRNVFVRMDDKEKGGIDQPIKLDVNFNVPLNEMFSYKDKLMPLFRKFN